MSPHVLREVGLDDVGRVGRKAATLGELARAGFPVPEGIVALPEDSPAEIAAAIRAMPGPFAVRSSGIAEDTAGASFAGLYDTVLDVSAAQVAEAVARVRASGSSQRVAAYAGSAQSAIPVLIQRLVKADVAGVAFTADPIRGDRDVTLVSAVRGLGERLVSGEANAEEWVVRGDDAHPRSDPKLLDAARARRVAELARHVEQRFGVPQDVEWAMVGGELYLLQARPMTALPEPVSWQVTRGAWVRNFRFGEWLGAPVTPLFESWALDRMEPRLRPRVPGKLHIVLNGWYFYSMDWFPPVDDEAIDDLVKSVASGVLSPFIIRPGEAHFDHDLHEWQAELSPAYHRAVQEAESIVTKAPIERLMGLIDQVLDHAGEHFGSITIVSGNAWKVEADLAEFYRRHLAARIGGSHLDLLAGLRAATFAPHAVESIDWYFPTAGERGPPPNDDAEARRARLEQRRLEAERRARGSLRGQSKPMAEFEKLLRRAQQLAPIREEQTAEFTLGWPVMRKALRRIGELLVARGDIAARDDVFFLRRKELDRRADRREVVRSRVEQWRRDARLSPPLVVGRLPKYWEAYYRAVADIGRAPGSEQGTLRGAPASPGRATGVARIVRSAGEFNKLHEGEVLVCPVTTPAWMELFTRAAAVVTDTGSAASHSSILAREFAIPAVVGTGDATSTIRDGQRVTVDGSSGVVIVHNG